MFRACLRVLWLAAAVLAAPSPALAQDDRDGELVGRRECDKLLVQWRRTHDPQARASLGDALVQAAVRAERPGYVAEVAADGRLASKELHFSRRARLVPLHVLRTFDGIRTLLNEEDGYAPSVTSGAGWLVRRLTRDAWEVWTPTHGWLFDGTGHVLNEARPARADPDATGREWFGAFLPDGRWVTTELEAWDDALTFFSRDGQGVRRMTSAELAPPGPNDPSRTLLGWARSDKDGAAWIVNVGSEQGYATVRVGPEGPTRMLGGTERWALCYGRALGPRGWYIELDVPDDTGQAVLSRREAGHGPNVGFPHYGVARAEAFTLHDLSADDPADEVTLPDGNHIFGFWPGGQDVFIGTETMDETRQPRERNGELPVVNKTWFFDRRWRLQGWTRARRLADAADGHSMLLRTDGDSRVITLGPDLHAREVRRFAWPDGATADAVTLFDDWRLGLFVRRGELVLAGW